MISDIFIHSFLFSLYNTVLYILLYSLICVLLFGLYINLCNII